MQVIKIHSMNARPHYISCRARTLSAFEFSSPMKLTKKLLASRVNSVRPYKSRSKRPCDFCRRRKTCCIIENLIPCLPCQQFNKGVCTFLEGPIKRRSRKAGEPRTKRRRRSDGSRELSVELDAPPQPHQDVPSLPPAQLPFSYDTMFNDNTQGFQQLPESHADAGAGASMPWNDSYLRGIRYTDMAGTWNTPQRSTHDLQQRQLTLSSVSTLLSASFWLDSLPGYESLLTMLSEFDDKRFVPGYAQSYFPPPVLQVQTNYDVTHFDTAPLSGWTYNDYSGGAGGMASGISETLTLQYNLATGLSPTTHVYGTGELLMQ